ncbi:MAG: TonB-dependent receptor [Betaproteobacteria bacterium]|nr:TonB-dependent receptor [Betaproteobacteria bacterium]MBK8919601.1 TonB-dependent receptor [Betaproteobacteria bacterium]
MRQPTPPSCALRPLSLALILAFAVPLARGDAVLPTVAVSASPLIEENRVDRFGSSSAVVAEEQLRDLNAVDLAAALRRTPGVEISRYNPVGSFGGDQGGAVYIRGLGVSRPGAEIKTYVDGVPFYMGVWGHPLLDLLPINGMRSITVHKSPQPQVNGNNFASINLETRRPVEEGIHGSVRLSAGSYGTVAEQADLAGRLGAFDFTLAQGYARSDGHRKHSDGELQNAMGSLAYRLDSHWTFGASFLAVDNEASDPYDRRQAQPAITPEYKSSAALFSGFVSHRHGSFQGELRLHSSHGKGNLYDDNRPFVGWGTFLTRFSMSGLRWKEQFSPWQGGTVMVGVDHDRLSGDVRGPFTGGRVDMPDFHITSPHLALSQEFTLSRAWSLVPTLGVRTYDHDEYGHKSAPHAGLSLVSEKLTLFANASRGISYPGLEGPALQAAIPFMFAGTTWKDLQPEQLDHAELGFKWSPVAATQIDASVFRDRVRNRYVYDLSFASTTFYNTGGYRMNGAEIALRQGIGAWTLFGGLTLLDPDIRNLPYTPKTALTLGINGPVGPLRVALDAQAQSEVRALSRDRNTLNPNTEKVDGFALVNVRVAYPLPALGKKGEVFVAVENLLDQKYAYRPGYPMPGTNGQIGVAASF